MTAPQLAAPVVTDAERAAFAADAAALGLTEAAYAALLVAAMTEELQALRRRAARTDGEEAG